MAIIINTATKGVTVGIDGDSLMAEILNSASTSAKLKAFLQTLPRPFKTQIVGAEWDGTNVNVKFVAIQGP